MPLEHPGMDATLQQLFDEQAGVATSGQILSVVSRYHFESALKARSLERVWQGIYCCREPTDEIRLRGLDLSCGSTVAVCLATAASLFGFDTEHPQDLHVLNPSHHQIRPVDGSWCTVAMARPWSWLMSGRRRRPRGLLSKSPAASVGPEPWQHSTRRCAARHAAEESFGALRPGRRVVAASSPCESCCCTRIREQSRRWRARRGSP